MVALVLENLNTTTLGFIAVLLFSFYVLRRSKSAKDKAPPEAGGAWPIIGHLPLLARAELPHIALATLADKYGPIFTIRIGIFPALVVNSWELVKELFTIYDVAISSRPKLTGSKLLGHNFVGFGFSPYGEYWREMRKLTALNLLSSSRLEILKHVRATEVEDSIKDLYKLWKQNKNEASQVLVEMNQWFGDINLNVILRMVAGKRYFGSHAAADRTQARRCQKVIREFFHLLGQFVLRDAIPCLGWLDLGGYEKAMKRTAEELDHILGEWLEEHRTCEVANKEQDFMNLLLSALDGMDLSGYDADTVCKATSLSVIAGGIDTITVTVTWGLSLLLNNPAAMRKVQEELDSQIGKDRLLTESDMDKLVYLQAAVKEILRLYPAGTLAGPRVFSEDCTVGGYHIPAGTRLMLNLHKIHRDPRVWSNAHEFMPERFLSTHKDLDVKGQHFQLIPFGAGRRICPGVNLGIRMTQLVLASFLQAFEISTSSNAPIDMAETAGLTNCKATPLEVLVKPRLPAGVYEERAK